MEKGKKTNLINLYDLQDLMESAKKKVVILGVTHLGDDFDWDHFATAISPRIGDGSLEVRIFRESDNFIYGKSLISENRAISGDIKSYSFTQLRYAYNAVIEELRKKVFKLCCTGRPRTDEEINLLEKRKKNYKTNFSVRTMCLDIPVPAVCIDDDYYITMSLTRFFSNDRYYEKLDADNVWYDDYVKYLQAYLEKKDCSIKYSGKALYEDEGRDDEILELYDVDRVARGLYPRDCFYETNNSQLVIWDFVFSRSGKLLLHKRKWNAKDNVGMWDKSVGGHVDYSIDFDSTDAATRELVEELFNDEGALQTHGADTSFHKEDTSKFVFLGEWNKDSRYDAPFKEIQDHPKRWFYFRLPKSTSIRRQSNRIMPPVFRDQSGEEIDIVDFKSHFTKEQIIELVKGCEKYKTKFARLDDAEIYSKIEPVNLLELLDYVRESEKTDLLTVAKRYGMTVEENRQKELNVISDIYFFIADEKFDEKSLKDLHNSDFALLEIEEIKEKQKQGFLRVSPDMQAILSNSTNLLGEIEECAGFLRRMDKRSKR